jgi:hypothetical protein
MVYIRILAKRNVDSLTKKVLYWKMPTGIRIVGVPKEPLSIAH